MRRSVMFAIVVAVPSLWAHGDASAQGRYWPWCVYYDAWTYNCGFVSLPQCLATAIGAGGACRPNPWGPPAAYSQAPRRNKRAR
jgi:hypothetical protein